MWMWVAVSLLEGPCLQPVWLIFSLQQTASLMAGYRMTTALQKNLSGPWWMASWWRKNIRQICLHCVPKVTIVLSFVVNNHTTLNTTRGQSLIDFPCTPVSLEELSLSLCVWLSCQWNQQPGFHTTTLPGPAQIMWWDCGSREISFCGRVGEVKITCFHGWREVEAGDVILERMV